MSYCPTCRSETYEQAIPTLALPYVDSAMTAHPAYGESPEGLRATGVLIGGYEPHQPKSHGGAGRFRWEGTLELLAPKRRADVLVGGSPAPVSGPGATNGLAVAHLLMHPSRTAPWLRQLLPAASSLTVEPRSDYRFCTLRRLCLPRVKSGDCPQNTAKGKIMVDNSRRAGVSDSHDGAPTIGGNSVPGVVPLRTYDAWLLPVGVLLGALKVEVIEKDLVEKVCAALVVDTERTRLFIVPGTADAEKEQVIRRALAGRIGRKRPDIDLSAAASQGMDVDAGVSALPDDSAVKDLPEVVADVFALYEGSSLGPMNGWRSDEETITALRSLITESLGGMAEDVPEDAPPMPEGAAAAVAFGYNEAGDRRPLVFMRTDIPIDLRADLWGFCAGVAASPERVADEADESGIIYVGMERTPVVGPGLGLLGALMTQRMGRRPGDCAFSFLTPSVEAPDEVTRVA